MILYITRGTMKQCGLRFLDTIRFDYEKGLRVAFLIRTEGTIVICKYAGNAKFGKYSIFENFEQFKKTLTSQWTSLKPKGSYRQFTRSPWVAENTQDTKKRMRCDTCVWVISCCLCCFMRQISRVSQWKWWLCTRQKDFHVRWGIKFNYRENKIESQKVCSQFSRYLMRTLFLVNFFRFTCFLHLANFSQVVRSRFNFRISVFFIIFRN